MMKIDIKFDARNALKELQATPAKVAKANRAAINKVARKTRTGRFIPGMHAATGLPKRELQKAVVLHTANNRRDVAIIQVSGARIDIRHWNWRFVQVDPVRAVVQVQNSINGHWINAYAFVNPLGAKQSPLTRHGGTLTIPGLGVSPARVFGELTTQLVGEGTISEQLRDELFTQLERQLALMR